jgi:hypothetical protein
MKNQTSTRRAVSYTSQVDWPTELILGSLQRRRRKSQSRKKRRSTSTKRKKIMSSRNERQPTVKQR